MAKRRKRRRISPRFILFLLALIAIAGGVVFAVQKLGEKLGGDADVTPTPVPTATPSATTTPKPALPSGVSVIRSESANPSTFGFSTELSVDRRDASSFTRKNPISFGRDVEYASVPGILTFGGSNYRNAFSYGTVNLTEKRFRKAWEQIIGSSGDWSGTGWTGQPLIIQWPAEVRAVLGVAEEYKTKENFTEVIYPAMDGYIHFIDLDSGKKTRTSIQVGVVFKGTACLDPNGYPLLYVGQGIPVENTAKNAQAYVRVYNLITNEEIYQFGGFDYFSDRSWQAYDGSPIIANDTIVFAGENGVLYTSKLNTVFDAAAGTVAITPSEWVKYTYKGSGYSKSDAKGKRWYGIENSVAAFRNYAFFADNGGRLSCVDLNTMKLKYVTDVTDDTDASIVIEEAYDDNTIYLYTANGVRVDNGGLGEGYGYCFMRKINGLTGAVTWEQKWICSTGGDSSNGGAIATPAVGKGNASGLVFFSLSLAAQAGEGGEPVAETGADGKSAYTLGGRIIACNKATGEVAWALEQNTGDYWASPVLVYDENMKCYLIQCDRGGYIKLYDAVTGSKLFEMDLGSRIDSTPAVFNNILVVGSRGVGGSTAGAKIIGLKIS